jgi:hypothetical protein
MRRSHYGLDSAFRIGAGERTQFTAQPAQSADSGQLLSVGRGDDSGAADASAKDYSARSTVLRASARGFHHRADPDGAGA